MRPAAGSSRWTFHWKGLIPLLLIAVIAVVAWRWLDGTDVLSQDDDVSGERAAAATSLPADAVGVTPTTSTVPPTTTRPVQTTVPPSTTTTPPERRVIISGEMKPCRFGDRCLVASFRIEGFEEHPGRFVCVYPNSRSDFGFRNDGVDDACLSGDAGDTISIEVDGVASATISEENLDGTG